MKFATVFCIVVIVSLSCLCDASEEVPTNPRVRRSFDDMVKVKTVFKHSKFHSNEWLLPNTICWQLSIRVLSLDSVNRCIVTKKNQIPCWVEFNWKRQKNNFQRNCFSTSPFLQTGWQLFWCVNIFFRQKLWLRAISLFNLKGKKIFSSKKTLPSKLITCWFQLESQKLGRKKSYRSSQRHGVDLAVNTGQLKFEASFELHSSNPTPSFGLPLVNLHGDFLFAGENSQ